jgi:hypothetical protein
MLFTRAGTGNSRGSGSIPRMRSWIEQLRMCIDTKGERMSKKSRVFVLVAIAVFAAGVIEAQEAGEASANKAARVTIHKYSLEDELGGMKAPEGKVYLCLQTEWENVHPKQKVKKSDLEGKPDRTMGVGGLMGGKKKGKEEEYVDMDVSYVVPNFFDHAYLLADGQTYALDRLTEVVPDGYSLKKEFALPKLGDRKKVAFVYLIPKEGKNLAFQFFDYSNGHILVPIKGDLKLAGGREGTVAKALDELKDNFIEIAANKLDFQPEFNGEEAPEGWRYAVVDLRGKSLSAGNIIQIQPDEYIWLATPEGYCYYSAGGTTTEDGFIRFTPEVYQNQQVAFLVPASAKMFALGVRVQNRIYSLKLAAGFSPEMAKPKASHRDGKIMDVMLFGVRKEEGRVILDLGLKSLVNSGVEIQADQQFILKGGEEDISFDEASTGELSHRPPSPFLIPPRTFVRFELAFETDEAPAQLYYRGYESETTFSLK